MMEVLPRGHRSILKTRCALCSMVTIGEKQGSILNLAAPVGVILSVMK